VEAGLALLLQPTLSFVWDVLFFSRPMTAMELLGAGIALIAIYLGTARSTSKQI
jgi:drug/metabolite transporter (DMT)-like permease